MSRVSEWLETIGLAQYAKAFHANDIDIDLLGQLDDQILKDIGVSSAGHRLRIRNAIAKLSPVVPLAKNENVAGAVRPLLRGEAAPRQPDLKVLAWVKLGVVALVALLCMLFVESL